MELRFKYAIKHSPRGIGGKLFPSSKLHQIKMSRSKHQFNHRCLIAIIIYDRSKYLIELYKHFLFCRGVKDFTLELSTDLTTWKTVIEDTLVDGTSMDSCDIPFETFDVEYQSVRYIRFTILNTYGNGGIAMHYLGWNLTVL